jgi:hypothetical protein
MAVMEGGIFNNLGLSHPQSSDLRVRADVLDALLRVVQRDHLTGE